MTLVPTIFIVGLITFLWIAALPTIGVPLAMLITVLLAGVGIGLMRRLDSDAPARR